MPRDITVTFDDGSTHVYKGAPDEVSPQDVAARAQKEFGRPVQSLDGGKKKQLGGLGDLAAGALRGAGSIGATLLAPIDIARDAIDGKGLSLESNRERRQSMTDALGTLGADTNSYAFGAGKVGTEIAGTLGVGGAAANGLARVPGLASAAPSLINAIRTGGMTTGAAPAVNALARAADLGVRTVGGAVTGGLSAGLVDPNDAGAGALIGGALPGALKAAGAVGQAVGGVVRGPAQSAATAQAVQNARNAGLVIPPSQANPTAVNKLMEGFAGKLTTAQNASAKNQPIFNELAKTAIGASDLTPASLQAVRDAANQSYDNLAQVGAFQADQHFVTALQNAGGSKALPGIANKEVDTLIDALKGQTTMDAQQTIESIKRLRFEGSGNKSVQDPVKKALGSAQMKIANAMEELIDRNLQQSGQGQLLSDYRSARQTLAKVYDVEKAMNPATGNIDASKFAAMLKKKRPLSGELKTIAEFATEFPTASKAVEKMGSLPQMSPLDWAVSGGISAATANPLMLASVAARPAARALALSPAVQNRLIQSQGANGLQQLLSNPTLDQLAYRAAPVVGAQ